MTYFSYLCDIVEMDKQDESYYILLKNLMDYKFVGLVNYDQNRAEDGRYLRRLYSKETRDNLHDDNLDIDHSECTILEMLVALATKMFEIVPSKTAGEWFWEILGNWLGTPLKVFCDAEYYNNKSDDILRRKVKSLTYRKYNTCGVGGLFPLKHAKEDMRKVELWYQMQNYISESIQLEP